MWSNFFEAGGFGMYPVSIFGFMVVVAGALFLFRPEQRMVPVVVTSGILTLSAGVLGAATGIVNTLHYARSIAPPERFDMTLLGCAESLNDLVLALMLVIVAGLLALAGTVRAARMPAPL